MVCASFAGALILVREPFDHFRFELDWSLMKTINSLFEFQPITRRTRIASRRMDVNINII
jgi:hypothetical protein